MASEWQDIATAPKECKKDVLLFGVHAGAYGAKQAPRVWTGCWWPSETMPPGWWSSTPNTGEVTPTHWMPLPEPLPEPPAETDDEPTDPDATDLFEERGGEG